MGYEEGEEWVLSKMKTGYPRYFGIRHGDCSISNPSEIGFLYTVVSQR